jgi:hypothetical protein
MIHHEEAKYATDEIQTTVVTVKTKRNAITFAAAYCLQRYNLKKTDYLNFLSSLGERFMVGGDHSAKNTLWESRLTTRKGKELYDATKEYRGEYHSTGKQTYGSTDKKENIRFVRLLYHKKKILENYTDIKEEYGLSSDHSGVILTLSETIIRKEANPTR